MTSALIPLGAPGIYHAPDEPLRALTGVRMDVCAFVGVAPRGPAREPVVDEIWRDDRPCVEPERPTRRTVPVAVKSFDEYRRLYGGFEGPGLLPYAVAAFFEQGGRCAYIARIVHEYGDDAKNAEGVAGGEVGGAITYADSKAINLSARSEGSWGNGLTASMAFTSTPLLYEEAQTTELSVADDVGLAVGTLLRLGLENLSDEFRFVTSIVREGCPDRADMVNRAVFDRPLFEAPITADVVEGLLSIDDGDGRTETHDALGLSAQHPRWVATVLCYESDLVFPDAAWSDASLTPDDRQSAVAFEQGVDRYDGIEVGDFFDPEWAPGDDNPGDGVHALAHLSDLSLLAVPDLYSPAPLADTEDITDPVSLARPVFARCVDMEDTTSTEVTSPPGLDGLRLDPTDSSELEVIVAQQIALATFAEQMRSFIALLDVPPGLNQREILSWRSVFHSSYAAAYHPWLQVARRDDRRDALVRVPPTAVAAGIVAAREAAFGVPHGPANVLAAEVVHVDDTVSPARHDELHLGHINVYLPERDGIRLTAARTLSRNPDYRQVSVRRLMTMVRRTLHQQMQWMAFEPNNAALRAEVRQLLLRFLRRLFRAGAFRGASEEESFFVECGEALNTQRIVDAGQLIVHVGVAPAEPLEYIVLRISREGDGTLTIE
jgi:hypothetical protein